MTAPTTRCPRTGKLMYRRHQEAAKAVGRAQKQAAWLPLIVVVLL